MWVLVLEFFMFLSFFMFYLVLDPNGVMRALRGLWGKVGKVVIHRNSF